MEDGECKPRPRRTSGDVGFRPVGDVVELAVRHSLHRGPEVQRLVPLCWKTHTAVVELFYHGTTRERAPNNRHEPEIALKAARSLLGGAG